MKIRKTINAFFKILSVFIVVLCMLIECGFPVLAEGNISVSTDNISIFEGDTYSFTISARNAVANVDIYSSDRNIALVDIDSAWIDNETIVVNVTAAKVGYCTIYVDILDAASYDEQGISPRQYEIPVEVKEGSGPQDILSPYCDTPSGDVIDGTVIHFISRTPDAKIFYAMDYDGTYQEYNDGIVLNKDMANDEGYISVTAYAQTNKIIGSSYSEETIRSLDCLPYEYKIIEINEGYGDIDDDDKENFADLEDIPEGFWFAGVEDKEYTGKAITQNDIRVYYHKTKLVQGKDYTISYRNNINASKEAIIIVSGKGNYSGQMSKTFSINPIDISGTNVSDQLLKYSGNIQKVNPKIILGNKTLKQNVDYSIIEINGKTLKDAGKYDMAIVGKENYSGAVSFKTEITKKVLMNTISMSGITNRKYDGKEYTPEPNIAKVQGKQLQKGIDYELIYDEDCTSAGQHKIIVRALEGSEIVAGEKVINYTINGVKLVSTFIKNFRNSIPYDSGNAIEQSEVYLKAGNGLILEEGLDYEVEYSNNRDIGTATVVYRGINGYSGTVIKKFSITGTSLSKYSNADLSEMVYTGYEVTQTDPRLYYTSKENGKVVKHYLEKDGNYEISYVNNINAGTAKIIYKGINSYTGTITKSFRINSADISAGTLSVQVNEQYSYVKGGVKPEPIVSYMGKELIKNKDYTLTYDFSNIINDNTSVKQTGVVIKGKGNYRGTTKKLYEIVPSDINYLNILYNDRPGANPKASVKITDINGKVLSGSDYEIVKCVYNHDVKLLNGTKKYKGESVGSKDVVPSGTIIKVSIKGKNSYKGNATGYYKTYESSISSVKVTIPSKEYTGKEISLSKDNMVVKLGLKELSIDDYDIIGYANNINCGNATVVIKGKGKYGGTKEIKFSIKSKNMLCTVYYDGNGSTSGSMANQTFGVSTKLLANRFARTGYRFLGWSTSRDGNVEYENLALFPYDLSMAKKTITLYAIWEAK